MSIWPQAPSPNRLDFSLSRLLGGREKDLPRERYQEPRLEQTSRGVWFIRPWVDVIKDGRVARAKKTIPIGSMGKREAQARAREIMSTINRAEYVITSQINVGKFLDEYETMHVERQAASTRAKYYSHLKHYIRPTWEKNMLCDLKPLIVQQWLDSLELSWATKTDIRNILSNIFRCAIEWGRWKDTNPIERVRAGRKRAVRPQRKLTDDETRRLLAALPADVRLLCCVCLFTAMRISEVLGLQQKHLDFERNLILVRQRYYRGDVDVPKNAAAVRDVGMGYLSDDLRKICTGDPEHFVFRGDDGGKCRDDRIIHQNYLRPAAEALGIFWPGFGFHSFRREAITAFGQMLSTGAVMRLAGHSTVAMNAHYTLADTAREDAAIRGRQEAILGKVGGKVQ